MPLVLRQKDVIIGIVHISINKGGACYRPEKMLVVLHLLSW